VSLLVRRKVSAWALPRERRPGPVAAPSATSASTAEVTEGSSADAPAMVVAQPGNPSPTSGEDAALMAELFGSGGTVTTVDIDREVTDRARTLLDTAGYSRVKVVLADAENGVPEHAPFDRIIVTVGACASRRPGWSSSPTTGTSSSRCGHGA
jgi:protein-L-isoaspartate(D-aspartate) O-methyltransferase